MADDPPKPGYGDAHELHSDLLNADDEKIRRVLAVVDDLSDPGVNQALLDPLRSRLATLRPARPLRFARLLFIPLDPLTVPIGVWQVGEPAVPRPILTPVARIVRGGLGSLAASIDTIIANTGKDAARAITQAGQMLWPRAAEILATAAIPSGWPQTGVPANEFGPLIASIVAVLRRAMPLRRLVRDAEVGALEPDPETISDILRDIATESQTGRAMIARLILVRAPHAVPLLRRLISDGGKPDEKAAMQQAMEHAVAATLVQMERETAFSDGIGRATLADVGGEARRVMAVLRMIEADPASGGQHTRLRAIRAKLDDTCRERFARGVGEGLVRRLMTASGAVDGSDQAELETCARDLRRLDTPARTVGSRAIGAPDSYDVLLARAAHAVRVAAEAGTLTPMRHYRLVELLEGPDAAEVLYLKAAAKPEA